MTKRLGMATVCGGTFFVLQDGFEGMNRPLLFWKRMLPIYFDYKYNQWQGMTQEWEWKKLHEKYAPQVLDIILELKGIYIKIGQVLSQRPDILPKEYRDAFHILLDGIPGKTGIESRNIVEKSLGVSIESVFSYFDDIPLGAASIGQVHRATLLNGKDVVVKVQHPEAYELFGTDISTINQFVRLAQPEQELILDEFEKQMLLEFDFHREAWALESIYQNLKTEFPTVLIPRPVPELTRKNLIVMDYIPGVKLIDAVVDQAERIASDFGMSSQQLAKTLENPSIWFQTKFYSYFITAEFYRMGVIVYNRIFGSFTRIINEHRKLFDISLIYDLLLQVHGKQFLIDGIFNGDPHRILLLK
jgi:aarF domain-containing kinase